MTIQRVHNHDLDPTCRETRGSNGLLRGECLTAEYEATDADLDAIAEAQVDKESPVESTAELLRRLTKERNEAVALLETRALGVHPDCHNDAVKRGDNLHKRALRAEAERDEARASLQAESDNADREHARADALAAKLARVEALDDGTNCPSGLLVLLRTALADADATAASPSGLDVDPAAERPNARPLRSSDTPATTEACICRPAWPGVAGRLVHAECPVHAQPAINNGGAL